MANLPFFQVDAFTHGPFTGNPAAVVPLKEWLPVDVMQNIALENNLSETAFIVPKDAEFQIRWFTPLVEVDLCGHATLASAYVVFEKLEIEKKSIVFHSNSGPLYVSKEQDYIMMDFPADELSEVQKSIDLVEAIGADPSLVFKGRHDILMVFESHELIQSLKPNFNALANINVRGVLVTAPGFDNYDFVSRGFFPATGVNEDPATGSAHTTLTPYWSGRLSKNKMKALQMSSRGGYFELENRGDRIILMGKAHLFAEGKIFV